jgi:hypothetical protein
MTETEAKVVAAWKEAAADLGFSFTSPYVITFPDSSRQEHLGLVHHFGCQIGTLISVLHEPSESFRRQTGDDYFWSILGPGYGCYNRDDIIETLDDWGYFGPVASRPVWYAPAAHWVGDGPMGV